MASENIIVPDENGAVPDLLLAKSANSIGMKKADSQIANHPAQLAWNINPQPSASASKPNSSMPTLPQVAL